MGLVCSCDNPRELTDSKGAIGSTACGSTCPARSSSRILVDGATAPEMIQEKESYVDIPVRFVALQRLKELGRMPRFGSQADFVHPQTGEGNVNICQNQDEFDASQTLFIFVSHRWDRPVPGKDGHPDTADNEKCTLICRAAEQMKGRRALVPEYFEIALWIDYSCIDQDLAPMSELANLSGIMLCCDLMLTPVVDPQHSLWDIEAHANLFEGYKAKAWQDYWSRSWCRVEAMVAAVMPIPEFELRATCFNPGGLRNSCSAGRRPHFLFGTKELETLRPPKSVPPLLNSHFEKYAPEKGQLTNETDRQLIVSLTTKARANIVDVQESYLGDFNDKGQKHGHGKFTSLDGSIYEGQYHEDKPHGVGRFLFPDGRCYEGDFKEGLKHGYAIYTFADGGTHVGWWDGDQRNGHAVLTYPDGVTTYEGGYESDRRHGIGRLTFGDGRATQQGAWQNGEFVGPHVEVRTSPVDSKSQGHLQPFGKTSPTLQ